MAKFPVEMHDDEGQSDAINYLLSGPGGLGQNFTGFSAYSPGYLTGNFRPPFTTLTIVKFSFGFDTETELKVYPDATGITVGMNVTGFGIAPGTTVASIGTTVTGITLVKGFYTSYTPITLSLPLIGEADSQIFFGPVNPPSTFVSPISLGTSSMLDENTWKFEFSAPEPTPPFSVGQGITVNGVADDYYDGTYSPIGVVECTTTYVICRTQNAFSVVAPSTGGTAEFSVAFTGTPYLGASISTDCNGKVTVTSATDRVFLSAQLNNVINYETFDGPADLQYIVSLNRFIGFPIDDPINPEFRFNAQYTVSEKIYTFTGLTGVGTLPNVETILSTVIDQPLPAYYWYILEVLFYVSSGDMQITSSEFGIRSLSAQVVKQ